MSKIGYIRVSTEHQETARQQEIMCDYQVDRIFSEKISGTNKDRPQLRAMLDYVREGDTLYIESISRLGRSTKDLLNIIDTLIEKGVTLVSHKEIDKMYAKLYEDRALGKISDERFEQLSKDCDDEQSKLKADSVELHALIDEREQKSGDISHFIGIVRKYERITALTPEIMHELIDKIIVHEADKSGGCREQEVEIYFRFKVLAVSAVLDSREYTKKAA